MAERWVDGGTGAAKDCADPRSDAFSTIDMGLVDRLAGRALVDIGNQEVELVAQLAQLVGRFSPPLLETGQVTWSGGDGGQFVIAHARTSRTGKARRPGGADGLMTQLSRGRFARLRDRIAAGFLTRGN
jgi:hypothetical protein